VVIAAPLFRASENKVDGSYIVIYHNNITQQQRLRHQNALLSISPSHKIQFQYQTAIQGFSGFFTKIGVDYLLSSPEVAYVEEDQMAFASQSCLTQTSLSWGLGRLSTRGPPVNNNIFQYNKQGEGVRSYVIDTGILTTHQEFVDPSTGNARAIFGASFITGEGNADLNGHGTHVAGTIAGTVYGVAKKATVVAVKVLGANGSGSYAGVIAGVDWSAANGTPNKDTANLSLGGGISTATDDAVDGLVRKGIFTAVAAGNNGANACNYSPARAPLAFTVGSVSQPAESVYNDPRSYFSNQGPCVQIFAPGETITSAWIGSNTATRTISGTSMASPHVAGVASQILGEQSYTPFLVGQELIDTANANTITGIDNLSPNVLLFSTCKV
jgi:subtilisin family serine protease